MKKILLGIAAFITLLAGGFGANQLGSSRITTSEITLMSTSTASSWVTPIASNVNSYRHMDLTVASRNASGTIKFACSSQTAIPDFNVAKSVTNRWDYIQVADKEDGSTIDGDTGIVLADTTDVRQLEINDNYSTWCGALLTGDASSLTTSTLDVYLKSASNQ